MTTRDFRRSLRLPLLALLVCGAQATEAASAAPPGRAPLECDDPVVLRAVAAGLHFRGDIPEGYRPAPQGLRNPETGEELRVSVEDGPDGGTVLSLDDTRVELHDIRTTAETEDGWRCAADFTLHEEAGIARGDADYTVSISGLEFRIGGSFTIDGVTLRF